MADFVRFVFSVGGLCSALLVAGAWALVRRASPAPRRLIAAIVIVYSALSMYPLTHAAADSLSRSYHPLKASDLPPGSSAVVILGSGTFTAHDWSENHIALNDPVGADRVIEAARVFKLIHPDVIVSSGGVVGAMEPDAPAGTVMKGLLVRLGVPESRILVENESQNTHDEAVIIKRMLEPMAIAHVVIVTSDIHMSRSLGTFRAAGIDAIPAIARSPVFRPPWNIAFLPSSSGLNETQDLAHEIGGMGYYALRGWYR